MYLSWQTYQSHANSLCVQPEGYTGLLACNTSCVPHYKIQRSAFLC